MNKNMFLLSPAHSNSAFKIQNSHWHSETSGKKEKKIYAVADMYPQSMSEKREMRKAFLKID